VSDLTAMALPRATQSPSSSTSGTGNCPQHVPAKRRRALAYPLQHRQLRHADVHDRPGLRSSTGRFEHQDGDHIYVPHVPSFRDQCSSPPSIPLTLRLDPTIKDIDDFVVESICIGLCAASGNRHVDVLTRLFPPYSRLRDSLMHLCKCSTIGWDL
jgi:hypothetical protein